MKSFLVLTCLLALTYAATAATCTFDILVKTGDRDDAGTDSRISLQVSGADGRTLVIRSLKAWGQMSADHDYLERGNLDRFRGSGTCPSGGPCKMLLTSNGAGNKPGWYVSYVQVTQLGQASVSSRTHRWRVEQWLAVDEPPRQLSALRNDCGF
ncbi:hypothetical protein PR202_ga20506 [Eleusine coracana subsp. coracana]|uniref:PLAT domain-containing protein n=1 Tax=Eleusine coracana subsp. coracana TaxID=191504 RepID=A0AAV5CYX0_ELECO|nr:hypothetical protein PR202_ga20506 [Eleusine coracana subsp. coracana]